MKAIKALSFFADAGIILSGGKDKKIRVHNINNTKFSEIFSKLDGDVECISQTS